MPDLKLYREWLVKKGYQNSTIDATIRHLKTVWHKPEALSYRGAHVRRYLLYVSATRRNPLGQKFTTYMTEKHGLEAVTETRKHGARTKVTLRNDQWGILRAVLRSGDSINRLLIAYMESPFRISEFLDMELREVDEKTVCDKRSRDWLLSIFINTRHKKVYQVLCPTKRCAYSRMRRRLMALSAELTFEVDLDTLYKTFHARKAA